MNIKYKELSVIGKVWTIAEMFNAGIRDEKKAYVLATFRRLEELSKDEELMQSNAMFENSISIIIHNAKVQLGEIVTGGYKSDGGSIIENIWFNRIQLDNIKQRIKNDSLLEEDILFLKDIYYEIKGLWIIDLKEKKLSGAERRDLFKIKEEIEDLKIKIDDRVKRNQITTI